MPQFLPLLTLTCVRMSKHISCLQSILLFSVYYCWRECIVIAESSPARLLRGADSSATMVHTVHSDPTVTDIHQQAFSEAATHSTNASVEKVQQLLLQYAMMQRNTQALPFTEMQGHLQADSRPHSELDVWATSRHGVGPVIDTATLFVKTGEPLTKDMLMAAEIASSASTMYGILQKLQSEQFDPHSSYSREPYSIGEFDNNSQSSASSSLLNRLGASTLTEGGNDDAFSFSPISLADNFNFSKPQSMIAGFVPNRPTLETLQSSAAKLKPQNLPLGDMGVQRPLSMLILPSAASEILPVGNISIPKAGNISSVAGLNLPTSKLMSRNPNSTSEEHKFKFSKRPLTNNSLQGGHPISSAVPAFVPGPSSLSRGSPLDRLGNNLIFNGARVVSLGAVGERIPKLFPGATKDPVQSAGAMANISIGGPSTMARLAGCEQHLIGVDPQCFVIHWAGAVGLTWGKEAFNREQAQRLSSTMCPRKDLLSACAKLICAASPQLLPALSFKGSIGSPDNIQNVLDKAALNCLF
eukprot:GHVT01077389.1.p1 GENE.GHVT01077389.1~~GHVT01077389.1.p1  ORF type:complete len:527 (+),score=39.35 GHVT01077389.1:1190-2770(+)